MPKSFRQLAAAAICLALAVLRSAATEEAPPKDVYAELNPPAVAGVAVTKLDATSAEIEWPANLSTASVFRAEIRKFAVVDEELKMTWATLPTVDIARRGEAYRARLTGLIPQQPYWIRILPGAAAATASEPLFTVRFQTPAKVPILTARRATIGALLAALAVLAWLRWGRRAT